ncbi:MAG: hypothetical protein Kow0026_19530 [Oricola sp.]
MRPRATIRHVDAEGATELLARPGIRILDVRDEAAFRARHIDGAQNVSVMNLSSIIETTRRDTPILIYCYHGYASQEYAQIFVDFRFEEVYSLDGGFEAWESGSCRPAAGRSGRALKEWLAANGFPKGDPAGAGPDGMTPLMKAALDGRSDIVRTLLGAGADPDTRNADGNTALWFACVADAPEAAAALVEAGIAVDNRNETGATALMYAASTGKAGMVRYLLEAGADPECRTIDGFSALGMAATIECLALLSAAAKRGKARCLAGEAA